ncbi:MAG: hypothetical protein WA718_15380 [Terriglobales bacterium]
MSAWQAVGFRLYNGLLAGVPTDPKLARRLSAIRTIKELQQPFALASEADWRRQK